MSAADHPIPGRGAQHATRHDVGGATGAKTSTAATFALVFGVSALISSLTVILSVVGLILGIIGVVLGVAGLRMARRPGVTGHSVAIGGLVLSILAVLVAIAFAAGVSTFLNDQDAVNRLQDQVEQMRDDLPT
ncbi:hypothetical protein ACFP2T_42655 [Plantactinospora solaniradicis]|uniref:DUF4190 domain-containing protein n=1 Tax=Plantactinospora solaniradicis TaxID=1723736 RepID=A0ABW1KLZ3_9ACTN